MTSARFLRSCVRSSKRLLISTSRTASRCLRRHPAGTSPIASRRPGPGGGQRHRAQQPRAGAGGAEGGGVAEIARRYGKPSGTPQLYLSGALVEHVPIDVALWALVVVLVGAER